MSLTITLPRTLEAELQTVAQARDLSVEELALDILGHAVEANGVPSPEEVVAEIRAMPPSVVPAAGGSLADALRSAPEDPDFELETWRRDAGAGGVVRQAAQPGAGEQAAREVVEIAGAAESVHGLFDFGFRVEGRGGRQGEGRGVGMLQDRPAEPGTAQREVVEGDGVERRLVLFSPLERLCRPLFAK